MKTKPSFSLLDTDRNPIKNGSDIKDPLSVILNFGKNRCKPTDQDLVRNARQLGINTPIARAPQFEKYHIYATTKQKILVVEDSGDNSNNKMLLREGSSVILQCTPFNSRETVSLEVNVIRVSECENPFEEYGCLSYMVLIEWKDKFDFCTFQQKNNNGILVQQQVDNLIICGNPNGDPGSIKDFTSQNFVALPSDFLKETEGKIVDNTFDWEDDRNVVVSVIDTGLKYKPKQTQNQTGGPSQTVFTSQYIDSQSSDQLLRVAKIPDIGSKNSILGNDFGYCSVTAYLRACVDSSNPGDEEYKNKTDYQKLTTETRKYVLNSPYDDNLVKVFDPEKIIGRHGSINTAIINQVGSAPVLPVKAFDCAGWGTIFDLLCSLNYVLACKKAGMNIKIINASFVGRLNPESFTLLRSKFQQLYEKKIWVVAASGNDGYELKFDDFNTLPVPGGDDAINIFPACFSKMFPNVITVTDVNKVATFYEKKGSRSKPFPFLSYKFRKKIMKDINLDYNRFDWLLGFHYNGNYSSEFVNAAVLSPYNSPCNGEELHGTSFAAAYFSAVLAKHLQTNDVSPSDEVARQNVVNAITEREIRLEGGVKNGALLKMDQIRY